VPGCGHAERALQASWWQEHGAAQAPPRAPTHGCEPTREAVPPRAFDPRPPLPIYAHIMLARPGLSRSEGGTVARAGGTCGPLSARLDL